jgi:hypothetical protein
MTASTTRIEEHPDIVALRMRYEQANETWVAHIVGGLGVMAALYLAISPFVVGFQALVPLVVSNVLTGITLLALTFGMSSAYGKLHGLAWTIPALGLWTAVAPWVIRGGDFNTTPAVSNNVTVGTICFLLGLATLTIGLRRARR